MKIPCSIFLSGVARAITSSSYSPISFPLFTISYRSPIIIIDSLHSKSAPVAAPTSAPPSPPSPHQPSPRPPLQPLPHAPSPPLNSSPLPPSPVPAPFPPQSFPQHTRPLSLRHTPFPLLRRPSNPVPSSLYRFSRRHRNKLHRPKHPRKQPQRLNSASTTLLVPQSQPDQPLAFAKKDPETSATTAPVSHHAVRSGHSLRGSSPMKSRLAHQSLDASPFGLLIRVLYGLDPAQKLWDMLAREGRDGKIGLSSIRCWDILGRRGRWKQRRVMKVGKGQNRCDMRWLIRSGM